MLAIALPGGTVLFLGAIVVMVLLYKRKAGQKVALPAGTHSILIFTFHSTH
jgi:hypothetical protein